MCAAILNLNIHIALTCPLSQLSIELLANFISFSERHGIEQSTVVISDLDTPDIVVIH